MFQEGSGLQIPTNFPLDTILLNDWQIRTNGTARVLLLSTAFLVLKWAFFT